jgi:hypothetical protein
LGDNVVLTYLPLGLKTELMYKDSNP